MYIYEEENEIIACVIVNNHLEEFSDINWYVDAKNDEIIAIHTFAVNPDYSGNGIGKEIINQIKKYANANNKKTMRIDVIDGNVGAQKVFTRLGFEYIETIEMSHDTTGREKFHLYEYKMRM